MPLAGEIAPHLPYLRRFARALSGSQNSGDAYVVATLEAIIADPTSFHRDIPVRPALYRIFLKLWSATNSAPSVLPPVSGPRDADGNLEAITPLPRQAFLLRATEGFAIDEIAAILRRTPEDSERLVEAASREISKQMATSVLIIEDEPIIALDIEGIVTDLGHTISGMARTHREAVELVRERRPGLVLADIQLADGSSGLDAVNEILRDIAVPVIFVTAFPERLLTGERPEPAFLISKPFQVEALKATISQALFFNVRAGEIASSAPDS